MSTGTRLPGKEPRGLDQLDAAVRQLVAEVVRLGNDLAEARRLAEKAGEDAASATRAAAALSDAVATLAGGAPAGTAVGGEPDDAPEYPASWWLVDDPETARAMLGGLRDWLEAVYIRYQGAVLPDCWAWHPAVVAELWALRDAWYAVHYGRTASAAARMDWHERWRPGVADRVTREIQHCELERHTAATGRTYWRPPRVGGGAALHDVADWWAQTHGHQYPPAPSPDLIAEQSGGRSVNRY